MPKIIDRDFSVLVGRTSKNIYAMDTKVDNVKEGYIRVSVADYNDVSATVYIHITDVCNRYIIEELGRLGFCIDIVEEA